MFEQIGMNIFRLEIESETRKALQAESRTSKQTPKWQPADDGAAPVCDNDLMAELCRDHWGPGHDGQCVLVDISDRRWSQKASELKQKSNERS